MDEVVEVECRFGADGGVTVRRIARRGEWLPVEQGRQWVDGRGRHVMAILPTEGVVELLLEKETLRWLLRSPRPAPRII